MTFDTDDMVFVYSAVAYFEDGLDKLRTWLRDKEGIPLPGTEIIIAEMQAEIKTVRDLQDRIYRNSFQPKPLNQ